MRLVFWVGLAFATAHLLAAPPAIQGLGVSSAKLAVSPSGNLYVAGIVGAYQLRAVELSPDGEILANWISQTNDYSSVGGALIDSAGNLLIAGSTSSSSAFVAKVDAGLTKLISVIPLQVDHSIPLTLQSITANSQGMIYVGGWYGGQYGPGAPCIYCAFVGELSPQADQVIAISLHAVGYHACPAGWSIDRCMEFNQPGSAEVEDLAIDADQNVLFATGSTQPAAAKLSADLQSLMWTSSDPTTVGVGRSVTQDSDGNLVIAGEAGPGLTATANSYQPSPIGSSNGFVSKLDKSGSVIFSTYLGGAADTVRRVRLDSQDRIWAAGLTGFADFPTPGAPQPTGGFLFQIERDASALLQSYRFPGDISDFALLPGGGVAAVSYGGLLYWIGVETKAPLKLLGVCNLYACPMTEGQVSPGEFIRILLDGGGPSADAGVVIDTNGRVSSSSQGFQVTFDGVAAPLLHVDPNTIDAVVPFEVAGRLQTTMQVQGPGIASALLPLQVGGSNVTVLAVTNSDGSLNTPDNPAPHNSVITAYLSGVGAWNPPLADGEIVADSHATPSSPITLKNPCGTDPPCATLLFEGNAPGQIAGVLQMNIALDPSYVDRYIALNLQCPFCSQQFILINIEWPDQPLLRQR